MNNNIQKQKGVALIGVLIIVALITAAYSFLLEKQSIIFDNTKLSLERAKIFNYFYSIQDLAKDKLLKSLKDNQHLAAKKDNGNLEDWAYPISVSIKDGYISGKLIDRSSKLNINQVFLINKQSVGIDAKTNFNSCLINLSNQFKIDNIGDHIVDYLSRQDEKNYFLYIDDIKKIPGIDSKHYQKIKKFLYADVDRNFKININTASKEILMCLHNSIDEFTAKDIIANRPIKNDSELKNLLYQFIPNLEKGVIDSQIFSMLSVNSNNFELQSQISIGDSVFDIRSILVHTGGKINNHFRTFNYKL
jgi:type II secretory pathway component PulK